MSPTFCGYVVWHSRLLAETAAHCGDEEDCGDEEEESRNETTVRHFSNGTNVVKRKLLSNVTRKKEEKKETKNAAQ